MNFICSRVVKRLATYKTLKEKEDLFFDIIGRFNENELKAIKKYYKELSTKEKKEFFEDIQKDGIYLHEPPINKIVA